MSFVTTMRRGYASYARDLFGIEHDALPSTEPEKYHTKPNHASQAYHFIWHDVRARLIEDFKVLRTSVIRELIKSRFIIVENHVETEYGWIKGLDYIPCPGRAILTSRDAARWKAALGKTISDTGYTSRRQASMKSIFGARNWDIAHKNRLAEQGLPEEAMRGDNEAYLVITPGALNWDIPKRLLPPDWTPRWNKILELKRVRGKELLGQDVVEKTLRWFVEGE